jgi:hypothetical protein
MGVVQIFFFPMAGVRLGWALTTLFDGFPSRFDSHLRTLGVWLSYIGLLFTGGTDGRTYGIIDGMEDKE